MLLEVEIRPSHDVAVLRCRGRLVSGDGAALLGEAGRRALLARRAVALDLRPVTQMDAHGAGVLADLCATARAAGRTLLLAGASDRVRRLLHVTGLDTIIPADSAACADVIAAPAASIRVA